MRVRLVATPLIILSFWLILGTAWSFGQNAKNATHVPVFVTVMRPHGFEPSSVTLDARHLFLTVYNRTGLTKLTLALDRVQGNRVKQVDVVAATPHYTELFDLSPGTYTLSETSHSKWTCTIVVK
jgi:hypothetical protein